MENKKLEQLIARIRELENELAGEIEKKEAEFLYHIRGRKVRFDREMKRRHKALVQRVPRYLREASPANLLTVPLIWACLLPALLIDLAVTIFHAVCFPVYGIPKVRRGDYIVIDRHSLSYLNVIEKINCAYCGYFNGLIAYIREIAARTEQYWCPIKHARRLGSFHSRYNRFLEYGDAEGFRLELARVRRNFSDLPRAGK
ncbi:MAG: hypothetical protein ACNA74_03155 [Desulfurivibrio sp.]